MHTHWKTGSMRSNRKEECYRVAGKIKSWKDFANSFNLLGINHRVKKAYRTSVTM